MYLRHCCFDGRSGNLWHTLRRIYLGVERMRTVGLGTFKHSAFRVPNAGTFLMRMRLSDVSHCVAARLATLGSSYTVAGGTLSMVWNVTNAKTVSVFISNLNSQRPGGLLCRVKVNQSGDWMSEGAPGAHLAWTWQSACQAFNVIFVNKYC